MSSPVSVVKIHHEGGGLPHDDPGVAGTKGYSIWIGPTRYTMLRPPWTDFSTLNLNHVVLGVCYSGQRQDGIPGDPPHPVTDAELALTRDALANARSRGYVVDQPQVSPHDNLAGSATQCPGTKVYDRWHEIDAACRAVFIPPPAPEDDDMESYPYPHPTSPTKFSGAVIDRANKRVTLYGGAKIDQPTVAATYWGAPNPNPILTSYAEANGFCVVTADADEYHLHWA